MSDISPIIVIPAVMTAVVFFLGVLMGFWLTDCKNKKGGKKKK